MSICKRSEENIWKETKYYKRRENSENPWNEDHAVDDLASAVAAVSAISVVPVVACIISVADITADACTRAVVGVPDIFGVPVAAASMLFYLALPPPVTCIRKGNTVLEEDLTFYMSSHLVHLPQKRTLTKILTVVSCFCRTFRHPVSVGRYDNPFPIRFLAPIDCLKIPALFAFS
jgi:hypothetical protein